ncbi:tRNA (adenosine(37)-N6)-threonylcarbamoyltransferase complex dimerization subunit type 1 TsaB [Actinotalea sp. K2]|uniref:tRNA (adenosine(37)-N6)-threonylcarbamoyltransferase complex dimerization subunit type 1 TsaB n=1 Tax=Actinotalea sp. K2 TaxID=2939438 RepID=UPI00201731A8|nr:tRNA (adenosine(37)-N6)-threonylcarbamoyltransferase complex dimerization subunit type 1 TsaB [Actinotalea sp. K2]MCL3859981.1 tRNA (adenosine(37)-N6)-threonylcarbamoyltransferase complex dimerization subunit type 1 TsaB [Actinotalea sp. K2]
MTRVPVLALDTSADIAVTLVGDGEDHPVLAARRVVGQRRHAELLAPMIAEVLAEAGVDRRELGAVVVGTGPAPFTGLRAGLVTARTLAFALGVPVHGVCSLDAIAAEAFATQGQGVHEVVVVTDARRREVYTARYRRRVGGPTTVVEVEQVAAPAVLTPLVLAADGALDAALVVGAGVDLYPEHLTARQDSPRVPDPAVLTRLAMARVARGETSGTEPLYLRRPDVTPAAGRKRATG